MKLKFPFSPEGLKKISKSQLLIAALFGILLLVIAIPVDKKEKAEKESTDTQSEQNVSAAESSNDSYCRNLERQLKEILSAVDGVGRVEVMITMKDEGEAVVEKDVTKTEERTAEEDAQGTKRESSTASSQQETVYIREDSSGGTPFVAKQVKPKVEGVLVVAEGGNNARVIKNISEAILALFPVEAHKITVVEMKE